MIKFYRAFAWAFCISIFTFQISFASEYIPWQENDYLIYKSDSKKQQTLNIDATSSVWRHVTNFSAFGPTWIYSGSLSEEVKLYSPETINFQTFIDFSLPVGNTNNVSILPCNTGSITIAEKNIGLTVLAGKFDQVIKLNLETNCSDAGVTQIWFAKNIGIIQWTELNIAGIETYQLSQAIIGNNRYPVNHGLVVKAQFPETKIWINQMPFVQNSPSNEPPSVLLGLQIENYLDKNVVYQFNNAQRYDLIIRNETGVIVSQWSQDLVFAEVLGEIIIPSGGIYNVADTIKLIDDTGAVLPPGIYEFEISLTSSSGPKVSQMIEIDHAL